jgi:hypothetical protein
MHVGNSSRTCIGKIGGEKHRENKGEKESAGTTYPDLKGHVRPKPFSKETDNYM